MYMSPILSSYNEMISNYSLLDLTSLFFCTRSWKCLPSKYSNMLLIVDNTFLAKDTITHL